MSNSRLIRLQIPPTREKAIADRLDQAFSTSVAEANRLIDLETLVNSGTLGSIAGGTDTFFCQN